MKKCLLIGAVMFVGIFLTKDLFSATYDLTGTWNYTLSGSWASGDIGCNPGSNASGTCTIDQAGDTFTFAYTSGVVCDPSESCTFTGAINDAVYSCSTTDIVDDEGGSVTSMIVFSASSATSASGSGNSAYTHPSEEWVCTWGNNLTLIKSEDGAQPIKYTLTVNTIGGGTVTRDPSGGVYDPGTIVELTAVADPGWQFKGWAGDVTNPNATSATAIMDADKVVTATFVDAIDPGWMTVYGTVSYQGAPVCAMILANGQYRFTCQPGDDFGKYELDVPPDANGEITIFAFVSGLAPFRMTTDTSDLNTDIAMQPASLESKSPVVTTVIATTAATPAGRARITGTVALDDGTPLCAMVLANGQYMFSCGANSGIYDLIVPLDDNGEITLFVFVSGLQPYRQTFTP